MASISKDMRQGRAGYRVRLYVDGHRRELYVQGSGKNSERQAMLIAMHCDELAKAKLNNVPPAHESVAWANGTEGSIRRSLIAWGLAESISEKLTSDEGRLLGPFLEGYVKSRTDIKRRTEINYKQTRRLLLEYFGEAKPLRSITVADAERWRRWMLDRPLAVATVSKHCKRAKTMLAEAVKDRLLQTSPFVALKGGKESNESRQFLVNSQISASILSVMNPEWRLIFSLARYGGLRCPSEVLGLRWADIDWEKGKLQINSAKTGLRHCPMFPEIREALEAVFDPEQVYCVSRYRSSEQNLRTQFTRILKQAGIKPWPKLFVNLRSTRRTELQERFPDHVVNRWLGHSGKVAEKHYLQVTEEHWERASELSTNSSPIVPSFEQSIENRETKKPSKKPGFFAMHPETVTPTGVEPVLPPSGIHDIGDVCPPDRPPLPAAASPATSNLTALLNELTQLWPALDDNERLQLLGGIEAIITSIKR